MSDLPFCAVCGNQFQRVEYDLWPYQDELVHVHPHAVGELHRACCMVKGPCSQLPDALFREGEHPTQAQLAWGREFLGLWSALEVSAAGAGVSWFWRRVARFLREHEPSTTAWEVPRESGSGLRVMDGAGRLVDEVEREESTGGTEGT